MVSLWRLEGLGFRSLGEEWRIQCKKKPWAMRCKLGLLHGVSGDICVNFAHCCIHVYIGTYSSVLGSLSSVILGI